MKKIASFFSWLLLLGPIAIGTAILVGQPPLREPGSGEVKSPAQTSDIFAAFPVNQTKSVDFDIDDSTASQLTPRELVDQKRDWLLYTIASSTGSSASSINRSLFDLSPVRHGYLDQVSHFDYGETRMFCLDEKRVIALVPKADDQARRDDLSRVFDEACKNLGTAPESVEVFEYTFDGASKGTITRQNSVPGSYFLGAASGYRQASVSSATELKDFLNNADDLVLAKVEGGRLQLGGRKLAKTGYQSIALDEVAAIWQSEQTIQQRLQQFNEKWERRLHELNSQDRSRQQYDLAFEALQKEHDQEMERLRLVSGSGFSLDPTYDYAGLAAALAKPSLVEVLQAAQYPEEEQSFYLLAADHMIGGGTNDAAKRPAHKTNPLGFTSIRLTDLLQVAGFGDSALKEVIDALTGKTADAKGDEVPFLKAIDEAKKRRDQNDAADLVAAIFERLNDHFRFQQARYDGPLQGTEPGMVLFYTDLLAKLWAIDYLNHAPSAAVDEFEPLTRTILPAAYRAEEVSLPNVRLWFGPEDNGYQLVRGNMLAFARNATRIYAASSNPLNPGKETEPTASADAFLGWWNNHFEEVAAYEPQYRRLNEIMKWSLVISWLNQSSSGTLLQFLADVPVNRSAWFPDWARHATSLRFRDWDKVPFFQRGYLGAQTEAMPILFSDSFRQFADEDPAEPNWTLSGGVSLASEDLLKSRTALSEAVPQLLRRSGLDYGKSVTDAMDEMVTTRGIRYHFDDQFFAGFTNREISTTTVTPKEGLKFRGRYGDLRNAKMERIVSRAGNSTEIEARTATGEIGSLSIAQAKNGFRIGWHAREVDDGYTIARRLSSTADLDLALKADPLVEYAAKDASGVYYVKSAGSRKWMKLAPEGQNLPEISDGWDGRVCDLTPDAKPVNVAWIDEEKLPPEVRSGGNWVRGPPPPNDPGLTFFGDNDETGKGLTWKEAAQDIAKDPLAFKQHRDKLFTNGLREIDRLLANQEPLKALSLIDDGLIRFGDHEALKLRQAFAQLDRGRADAMLDAVNAMQVDKRSAGEALINEVNERLKASRGSDDSAYRIAEGIDWKTCPLKPSGDQVVLLTDKDGKPVNDLRFNTMPNGTPVSPQNIPLDAHVYCENTPGLNRIDWSAGMKRALDQIAGHQLGEIIALPRGDIAHFDPAHLVAGDRQFSRVASNSEHTVQPRYVPWNGNNNDDDDRKEKHQGASGEGASSGQVFLIVSS